MEVVSYLNKRNKPGIIVSINFEKCFDRVEFKAIEGMFRYFGFGDGFIKMMFLLFSKLELCTNSNGFTSPYLCKGRGTNQGDPTSPLIYCYCGEILAHLILNNPNIKGIDFGGIQKILSQFVGDMAAFLSYDRLTLEEFSLSLMKVEHNLGLKVSYDKTSIYRVGSLYNTNAKLITQKDFHWTSNPKLNTWKSCRPKLNVELNVDKYSIECMDFDSDVLADDTQIVIDKLNYRFYIC